MEFADYLVIALLTFLISNVFMLNYKIAKVEEKLKIIERILNHDNKNKKQKCKDE